MVVNWPRDICVRGADHNTGKRDEGLGMKFDALLSRRMIYVGFYGNAQ